MDQWKDVYKVQNVVQISTSMRQDSRSAAASWLNANIFWDTSSLGPKPLILGEPGFAG